jgi:hypothetical protein
MTAVLRCAAERGRAPPGRPCGEGGGVASTAPVLIAVLRPSWRRFIQQRAALADRHAGPGGNDLRGRPKAGARSGACALRMDGRLPACRAILQQAQGCRGRSYPRVLSSHILISPRNTGRQVSGRSCRQPAVVLVVIPRQKSAVNPRFVPATAGLTAPRPCCYGACAVRTGRLICPRYRATETTSSRPGIGRIHGGVGGAAAAGTGTAAFGPAVMRAAVRRPRARSCMDLSPATPGALAGIPDLSADTVGCCGKMMI